MTTFVIKLIAIVTMVIDHVGLLFFPEEIIFRVVGRFSFPLFAWLIANGAKHTKNMNAYVVRLFVFALFSQIPYMMAHRTVIPGFLGLNIFFTLFLGLVGIKLISSGVNKYLQAAGVILISLGAEFSGTDYGAVGVLSIIFFYIFYDNFKLMSVFQFLLHGVLWYVLFLGSGSGLSLLPLLQPVALFSLIIIFFYSHRIGPKMRYLFYAFYPLHLLVLYFIRIYYVN